MDLVFDINDRTALFRILKRLETGTKPFWGKMKPQQMVEHLIDQVRYTNGKKIPSCNLPSAEAEKNKIRAFNSEIPRNIFLETPPEHYEFTSLERAIKQLLEELTSFDLYFKKFGNTALHGSFGAMNHEEWIYWHGRHFYHHLKQFNLIN